MAEQTPVPEATPEVAATVEATPDAAVQPTQTAGEQTSTNANTPPSESADAFVSAQEIATPEPTAPTAPAKAVLSFQQKVPVNIRVDGKQFFSGTHNEGDLEIVFTKTADIYIDDGSKATLNYGGWDNHGTLGWAGRKRRVILNAVPYSGKGRGQF